jgi:hypothetical protein
MVATRGKDFFISLFREKRRSDDERSELGAGFLRSSWITLVRAA